MTLPLLPLQLSDVPPGLIQALEQEGVPFVHDDVASSFPQGMFLLFDSRRCVRPATHSGQLAIDIAECDQGGDDSAPLTDRMMDQSCVRRQWRINGQLAEERVPTHNKQQARRQLLANVRAKVESAGGVWLMLASVPAGYQSAFCLRIDYDESAPDDVDRFLSAIAGHEHATSHYVCGAAYHDQSAVLARLKGLHVGTHGYWHHTYLHATENFANIARGLDVLEQAGLEPHGFVAPHGRFNAGLLKSLEQLGVSHSSEFSLTCDDRPFAPRWETGRKSSVLQIPVHPVSLGILLEAIDNKTTPTQVTDALCEHYCTWLNANHAAGETTILYGHPERRLGRFPQVVQQIWQTVDSLPGLWKTNLREYEAWWRARSKVQLRVDRAAEGLRIQRLNRATPWIPAVEVWQQDQVAKLALDVPDIFVDGRGMPGCEDLRSSREIDSRTNRYTNFSGRKIVKPQLADRPEPPTLGGRIVSQPFSLRSALKQFIDWERDTPTAELPAGNLRQLLKKSLRYALPEQK